MHYILIHLDQQPLFDSTVIILNNSDSFDCAHLPTPLIKAYTLLWRQSGLGYVSNLQPQDCLLNRVFRRRSKKTSKLRVTGLCVGNSPHEWPVTRKMFPFDDEHEQCIHETLEVWCIPEILCCLLIGILYFMGESRNIDFQKWRKNAPPTRW